MAGEAAIANAYLAIIPSMAGAQGAITSDLTAAVAGASAPVEGAASKAGTVAGASLGAGLLAKAKSVLGPAAVGAALVGVGKSLYDLGSTFDDVTDTIRVGTGASGDALTSLVDVAKQVGSEVPASWEDVGQTVADLNTRLGLSGDSLQTVAEQYLEAGRILGQSVDVQKTTAAFSAFGIEGANVESAMDSLFQVSQATGVGMNDLAQAVAQNAPAMQNLGFSFEQTAALAGSLDKAGINSTATLSAMGKGLVSLAKDGEEPQAAFRRVTSEIEDLVKQGDIAGAIDLASGVFGTKAANQFVGAVQNGSLALGDLMGAVGASNDTILGVGAETMDFAESWDLVKQNAQLALEPLGSAVFGAVGSALSAMVEPMQRVASFFQENPAAVGALAAVVGGALMAALVAVTGAMWAWVAAQLASPTTWIILGIVALIAAIVALAANWDSVVAWVQGVGQSFAAWWSGLWDSISSWASSTWQTISSAVSGTWQSIVSTVQGWGDALSAWWSSMWAAVGAVVSGIWSGITSLVSGAVEAVRSAVVGAVTAVSTTWTSVWTGALSLVSSAWSSITSAVSGGVSSMMSFITGIPGRVQGVFAGAGSWLINAGRSIIDGLIAGIRGAFDRVKSTLSNLTSMLPDWKGPEDVDRVLLWDAGQLVIGGFIEGMESQYRSARQSLTRFTGSLAPMYGQPLYQPSIAASTSGAGQIVLQVTAQGDIEDQIRRAMWVLETRWAQRMRGVQVNV